MQDDFVEKVNSSEIGKIISEQIKIIRTCSKENIPLIVLEFEEFGKTITSLENEIKKVPTHEKFIKKGMDGFIGTHLLSQLKKWRIRTILIAGLYGDKCVRATAKSARFFGFNIITAKDLLIFNDSAKNLPKYWKFYHKAETIVKRLERR